MIIGVRKYNDDSQLKLRNIMKNNHCMLLKIYTTSKVYEDKYVFINKKPRGQKNRRETTKSL